MKTDKLFSVLHRVRSTRQFLLKRSAASGPAHEYDKAQLIAVNEAMEEARAMERAHDDYESLYKPEETDSLEAAMMELNEGRTRTEDASRKADCRLHTPCPEYANNADLKERAELIIMLQDRLEEEFDGFRQAASKLIGDD